MGVLLTLTALLVDIASYLGLVGAQTVLVNSDATFGLLVLIVRPLAANLILNVATTGVLPHGLEGGQLVKLPLTQNVGSDGR